MGTDAKEAFVSSKSIEGEEGRGGRGEEDEGSGGEEEEGIGCLSWRCRCPFASSERGCSSLPESDSSTAAAAAGEEVAACLKVGRFEGDDDEEVEVEKNERMPSLFFRLFLPPDFSLLLFSYRVGYRG